MVYNNTLATPDKEGGIQNWHFDINNNADIAT